MCMFAHPAWEHGHADLDDARSSAVAAGRAGLPPGAVCRGALGEALGAGARSLLRTEPTGGGGPDPALPVRRVSALQRVPPTLQPPARGSQLAKADSGSPQARGGRGGCGSTALRPGAERDPEISPWSPWLLSRSRAQSAPGDGFISLINVNKMFFPVAKERKFAGYKIRGWGGAGRRTVKPAGCPRASLPISL